LALDRGYIDGLSMTLSEDGKVANVLSMIREYVAGKAARG
jgi:hypothetical protein